MAAQIAWGLDTKPGCYLDRLMLGADVCFAKVLASKPFHRHRYKLYIRLIYALYNYIIIVATAVLVQLYALNEFKTDMP